MPSEHTRICSICEAACGLEVQVQGRTVLSCRGNSRDLFSSGHVCAKGVALAELDADPDRLRVPLVRRAGELVPASWDEAMTEIARGLGAVRAQHGNDAVAIYIGNPTAHNIGLSMGIGPLAAALGSRNLFSAGSVDQLPKQLASELMFGNDMAVPVPDIERCDLLLMLGANPLISNGSLWMVPDVRGKLQAMRQRGAVLVVIDPRRTETAKIADTHLFIRPGSDAWLLAALINELHRRGRTPASDLAQRLRGHTELLAAIAPATVDMAAARTGILAADIHALAAQLHAAAHPVVYGRVGTTLQRFGTLTSFLIEALNIQLDALDRPGGAMFGDQPFSTPSATADHAARHAPKHGRWKSRVSGYPEVLGQMPVACMAEEMETPGAGQIHALVTIAGNPIVSNPDSDRLARAIAGLAFRVAIDIYPNETTRHADVVLPGTSPFEDGHYDQFLGSMGWRNVARYSPPVFPLTDRPDEWRTMLGAAYAIGHGRVATTSELDAFEDDTVAAAVRAHVDDASGRLHGRDVQEIVGNITPARGVERLLDLGIRAGRWGDGFASSNSNSNSINNGNGNGSPGLTLKMMADTPDGIDLGALEPSLDRVLGNADGHIDLAPTAVLAEVARLLAHTEDHTPDTLLLIGRRNAQTNNSWLHNLPVLTKGPARCVLEMHPDDAAARALHDGEQVRVRSAVTTLTVTLRVNADVGRGVVCLPHGFSAGDAPLQSLAHARATSNGSVNANRLAAAGDIDVASGTAALNGIAVWCERA